MALLPQRDRARRALRAGPRNRAAGRSHSLLAAVPLVAVTGHSPAVALPLALVSIFGAFYLMRVSYALMTFFITLLLGELYAPLGTFTPDLMLLRLAETVVGGAIGVAVAALVLPLRTAVVATAARRALLGQLRTLLEDLVRVLRDPGAAGAAAADLAGASRAVDARLHQLLLLDATLLRPAPFLRNSTAAGASCSTRPSRTTRGAWCGCWARAASRWTGRSVPC